MKLSIHVFSTLLAMAFLVAVASAQVTLKRGAVVYHGSAANTTAPATVNEKKVKAATVEWQKIEAEGIDVHSAQGRQLVRKMNSRIREAVRAVAGVESRDLVVRRKDIADKQGREVVDLTDKVVAKLEE